MMVVTAPSGAPGGPQTHRKLVLDRGEDLPK
jgi:hypothetical protein